MTQPGRFPIVTKMTEPVRVAYTQFVGVVNAPSRIWMLRDWAKREGYHLVGAPRCMFSTENGAFHAELCEVQWTIAEGLEPFDDEIGVRWLPPSRVVATYHQGDTADLEMTAQRLYAWGAEHGYRLGHSPCEIYWFDVRMPREHWITEIQLPVLSE
jgi:effector-binding domain-containing protein